MTEVATPITGVFPENETPEQTVERLERVPAESRTKGQTRAIAAARRAIIDIARVREATSVPTPPVVESPPAYVPPPSSALSTDPEPVIRERLRSQAIRELDWALSNAANLPPDERVKVVLAVSKIVGLTDENAAGDVPFVFRGWTQVDVVVPDGTTGLCTRCAGKGLEPVSTPAPVAAVETTPVPSASVPTTPTLDGPPGAQ